jgi:dihydroorotate dehydrogenase
LTLLALRAPVLPVWRRVDDPFQWQGLRFRNRAGIAAGFDKNAVALRGIESLGTGFVEIGTILVDAWPGNELRPRVKRVPGSQAIWNRLGFPSAGLEKIQKNLKAFSRAKRQGLVVGCNIGPHPGHVRAAKSAAEYLTTARDELLHLVRALFEDADFFVVNLSSPNTPGLRKLLHAEGLAGELLVPLIQTIRRLDGECQRAHATPLLVKLPPEDSDGVAWTSETLERVAHPLLASGACDGFVAVNSSSRLAAEAGEESGGISGAPLRPTALQVIRDLRQMIGPAPLIVGSGGLSDARHAVEFIEAGSDLVEMYSGLVYHGPGLITDCAVAMQRHAGRSLPTS